MPRQAPFALVWLVVLVGMGLIATEYWRRGLTIVGAAAVLAGVLRLVLPTRRAGWLAVRSRPIDVLCFGFLGVALAAVAIAVPAE
ncbi:MAG: DUF3017 domain-containing protein [Geodermatophilaceae bacterium]|nr:DUF3017 domain-containing protein [Geodermatophilaceae bacterium]